MPLRTIGEFYYSGGDGIAYIVNDCGDAVLNCLEGYNDAGPGEDESFSFSYNQTGTYYLILDTTESGSAGEWSCFYIVYHPNENWGHAVCPAVGVG